MLYYRIGVVDFESRTLTMYEREGEPQVHPAATITEADNHFIDQDEAVMEALQARSIQQQRSIDALKEAHLAFMKSVTDEQAQIRRQLDRLAAAVAALERSHREQMHQQPRQAPQVTVRSVQENLDAGVSHRGNLYGQVRRPAARLQIVSAVDPSTWPIHDCPDRRLVITDLTEEATKDLPKPVKDKAAVVLDRIKAKMEERVEMRNRQSDEAFELTDSYSLEVLTQLVTELRIICAAHRSGVDHQWCLDQMKADGNPDDYVQSLIAQAPKLAQGNRRSPVEPNPKAPAKAPAQKAAAAAAPAPKPAAKQAAPTQDFRAGPL